MKTCKLLTKHGFHHPKSNTHRLYLSRKHGGRGLIGVMDCHQQECEALAGYLKEARGRDPLVRIVEQVESRKTNGIMKYYVGTKNKSAHDIDKTHQENLHAMKLHGEYFNQQKNIPNVHIELSNEWLEKTYLRYETESLICAAQEQALATNYVSSKIWKIGNDPKCRLCRKENETIQHITSGCEMLAGTQYMRRHDLVGKYLHWTILKDLL